MANVHALETSGGQTRLVFHIAVPAGNNSVGTAWSSVLINSGVGGATVLPDGTGSGGTISAAEKAAIAAGTVYETNGLVAVPPGMTAAQANAFLDALHASKVIEIQAQIQARLNLFGYTR